MYKVYCDALATVCGDYFQQITKADVMETTVKRDQRLDAVAALSFNLRYQLRGKDVAGVLSFGFLEEETAVAVAATIARAQGERVPETLDDDAVALLADFVRAVSDRAKAVWEDMGFRAQVIPASARRSAAVRGPSLLTAQSFAVILALKVHHVVFRLVFTDDSALSLAGRKVLIADDSAVVTEILRKHLSQCGFDVAIAGNGVEAVARHRDFNPDITVMDVLMPGMNGLDAIVEIRQHAPDARFIVLSTSSRQEHVVTAGTLHVSRYLVKPVPIPEVLGAIAKALK